MTRPRNVIAMVILASVFGTQGVTWSSDTGYETNKFDLKDKVEEGGWEVAWADDITETDVIKGVVAAGVSVASDNPGPFLLWLDELINRTVNSLTESAGKEFPDSIRPEIQKLAEKAIRDAVVGRSANEISKRFPTIDFKAGAIKYSGKNKLLGQTLSRTWGIKPYIALRLRDASKPLGTGQDIPVREEFALFAIGDFNNDKFADFGIWTVTGKLLVNFNNKRQSDNKFPKTKQESFVGEIRTRYGEGNDSGQVPLVADFNKDGYADFGVYTNRGHLVINFNNQKTSNNKFPMKGEGSFVGEIRTSYGEGSSAGQLPIVGDFNADGYADFGVWTEKGRVEINFNDRNSNDNKFPKKGEPGFVGEIRTTYGDGPKARQLPIVGDFNADGYADFGVWTEKGEVVINFNDRNSNDNKFPKKRDKGFVGEIRTTYGEGPGAGQLPIVGDFNADGYADFGVWTEKGEVVINFNDRNSNDNKFPKKDEPGFVGEIRTTAL